MATGRTEPEPESPLGGTAARKRAFALAVALLAAAGVLIVLLGRSDVAEEGHEGEPAPERTVVESPAAAAAAAAEAKLDDDELRAARATAQRFALAYLARESGRMDAAVRRDLRSIGTPELWQALRQPPRATPAWQPPPARFEQISGVTETPYVGVVDVVVAYRVEQRRQYLTVRLSREGGRWRALPHGL